MVATGVPPRSFADFPSEACKKLTQASSLATCEAGTAGRAALSPCPPPHHACTPTASPGGVLRHRDDPFAVPPRSLRPCPHRCSHSHDSRAGSSLSCCVRDPLRGPRCRCVANGSCAPRVAQLHARIRQRRLPPELPRDGRRSSVRTSAGWEGVGGRWPACAIPKPAIWADQCLGHRGFHPSQATRARARGEGACCCAACQHNISARPAAPCAGRWPRLLLLPYLRWAAASR